MNRYNDALLVGGIPHEHARLHTRRDKVAVVEGERRLTWADVSERTARLANALADRGVRRGDKVAAVLQNRAEYVEVIYALAGLGATIVPVSYRFVAREIAYALEHADVVAAIVDADLVATFADANRSAAITPERVLVVGAGEDHEFVDYERVLARGSTDVDYLAAQESDIYHLAFTGGTTGRPKACEVPQRIARQNWYQMTAELGILEHDTTLIAGPFYHGLGFMWGLQQLMVGGTVVMLRTFDARAALVTMAQERITWTPMAPTMYSMMLDVPDKDDIDVGSMRGLVCAAAPLLTTTKEALLAYFTSAGLYEYYGATEAGFYSVLKPEDQLRKVRSVGQAWSGCELRIVGADGQDVPTGEVGLIYKRGMALGAAYYKNPEATEEAFLGEWMTSGDLGRLDDEGYLYVVDREKDMIISGGVNVFPSEIEEVLARHPGVRQVAVVGLPDDRWGEVVTAFVVARDGAEIDTGELDAACRAELAGYKRPRRYELVASLPQNSSGKLLKNELRARHAAAGA